MSEHIKNHTGENKYFCNICNKICNTSNELNEHIIEHTFFDLDDKTIIPQEPIKQDFKCISCNVRNNFNAVLVNIKNIWKVIWI